MAYAALGIGVGVLLLSFGLASGGVAVVLGHCTTTTDTDINININININDAVVDCNDEVSGKKSSSSSCYLSQYQQPQPEQVRKMEEEEAAEDGFITSGLKSDDQPSEPLILLPTAAAATGKREEEAAAVVDPAAPLNLFTDVNMKESSSSSSSSLWIRMKTFFFKGKRMKKKVSEICGRAKRGVRRWKGEVVELWCYLKDPDFWDGKKGRISRELLWLVPETLVKASTDRNKGEFLSTVLLQMFVLELFNILKNNFK